MYVQQHLRKLSESLSRVERLTVKLVSHMILAFFTVVIVYPVIWMLFGSLKTGGEFVSNVWGPPRTLAWENYAQAWERALLGTAICNSLFVSLSVVILVTTLAALAGYAFAKLHFRFSGVILAIFVLTLHTRAPTIPLYVLLVKIHATDAHVGLILPLVAAGLPLSIFIFRAFFQAVPSELMDAAKVDGCTDLGAFLRVVVPISGPAVATVAILQFLEAWNEYFLPLLVIRSPEMRTVPLAVQVFFHGWQGTDWQQVFAALSIGSVPMIVLYVFMQRQFIQGLTSGALKG